ncbi:MAG: cob(I)yrinic acid a,c-diamide adenosyltransferase [Clostridia bacterium]|nr:cob(I)yrinic acid a,c-diamide adenosyltransferase [Clostridia bacterium]
MMHKLHLYYGNGKGKTTSAMGLALRCAGHGKKVLVAQFLKGGDSGELSALRQLACVEVYPSARVEGFLFQMTEEERKEVRASQTQMALTLADHLLQTRPSLIILDEFAVAWDKHVIASEAARRLLESALRVGETVVTGYSAPQWLYEHADYVSHIIAERHPYDREGLQAREGIEW